jgi:CDP-4-dehydro-6-deoxyglucose reductase, E1
MRIIRVGDLKISEEDRKAVNEVLDSGRISEDRKTREFERDFSRFVGTRYAIAVNSGTSALIAGLNAVRLYDPKRAKPCSKVITAPVTYIATSNAIVLSGYEPVYVDVDATSFGITPETIKARLESADDPTEYSLILPVHLMGYPCRMDEINKLAKKYGLYTFEDSAQAHGTMYKGKKTGSMSLLADFSFYIAHNIQAGEMGAVTTDDPEIARLVSKIKAHGRMCDCPVCVRSSGKCPRAGMSGGNDDFDPRFTHDMIGYNFKTMEFQAALGVVQLKRAEEIILRRRENVKRLNEGLAGFSDVLQLPAYSEDVSYLAYPLVIKDSRKVQRKKLRSMLEAKGVETRPLFGCIPTQQPAYAHLRGEYLGKLPNAEYLGVNGFYIGCHQYLSPEDIDYTIGVFKGILGGA